MIVLALDTAGADCAACLYDSDSGHVLASVGETIGRGHAERLMGMVADVLAQSGRSVADVDRVAVTIGPGSFTGIRVAVAAARGLALSAHIDAVGVTTLDVMARQHVLERDASKGDSPFMVAMDAKRGEIYLAGYAADGTQDLAPCILALEEARDLCKNRFAGSVIIGSASVLLTGEGGNDNADAGGEDRFPVAIVARLGAEMPAGSARPAPLYLRGPDAKPQEGFALARKAGA